MIGINDREVAFAFNMECAEVLQEHETEERIRVYEAMGLSTVTNPLGGRSIGSGDRGKPIILNA